MDNVKPKFEQGDLVRHRASNQFAIVVSAIVTCTNHLGFDILTSEHLTGSGCEYKFNGRYCVDLGFDEGDEIQEVAEYLLEKTT